MLIQLTLIVICGTILYQYNMKTRLISQEITYINEILISDKAKLKIFKAKYAWLSSPEMIAKLSDRYLSPNIKNSYGFDVARTYNHSGFSGRVRPRVYTNLEASNISSNGLVIKSN